MSEETKEESKASEPLYFVATGVKEFTTKKAVEDFLSGQDGLKDGEFLIRGRNVGASRVYRIS